MASCFQGRVYKLNLRWLCASRLRGTIQFGFAKVQWLWRSWLLHHFSEKEWLALTPGQQFNGSFGNPKLILSLGCFPCSPTSLIYWKLFSIHLVWSWSRNGVVGFIRLTRQIPTETLGKKTNQRVWNVWRRASTLLEITENTRNWSNHKVYVYILTPHCKNKQKQI